ncbi:DMT family transporter [Actinomyces sp. zg-332]|uniref:DMT family transporter n=1 Tax=Actinomyces sp. zg-332 TaxID=2708340 RepID=UPI002FCD1907
MAFWRSFAGLIAMTVIFIIAGKFTLVKGQRFSPAIFFSGLFLGLLSSLYVISTQYTTLANASFLIYTGPVYSTILATVFLKESFRLSMLGSLGAVIIGTLLIVGIISENGIGLNLDPQYTIGNLIALASGVAYGLYLFVSRLRTDFDSNVRAWYNFLFAAGTIAIMVMIRWSDLEYPIREWNGNTPGGIIDSKPWILSEMGTRSWIFLIITAVITGFGAFYFLTLATKILFAGELATISYQETIMASLLGFVLFSETLTPLQLLGGALIVGGGVSQIFMSVKNAGAEPKMSEVNSE